MRFAILLLSSLIFISFRVIFCNSSNEIIDSNYDKDVAYFNSEVKKVIDDLYIKKYILNPNEFVSSIPLYIHQIWDSVLPKMNESIHKIIYQNPEFKYKLYSTDDCYNLIRKHFSKETLYSYTHLIPGAFKADLCRYCILYHYGGIYLDVKFRNIDSFKLYYLTDREQYVIDKTTFPIRTNFSIDIYNGVMINKPKSKILKKVIDLVNDNVRKEYYGEGTLYITGPHVLGQAIFGNPTVVRGDVDKAISILRQNNLIFHCCFSRHKPSVTVRYYNEIIIDTYPEYRDEQKLYYQSINSTHYANYWKNRKVYLHE